MYYDIKTVYVYKFSERIYICAKIGINNNCCYTINIVIITVLQGHFVFD